MEKRKLYRCKFTFLDPKEGVPLIVYQLENKVFVSKLLAWQLISAALEKFDDDDAFALCRIVVYQDG